MNLFLAQAPHSVSVVPVYCVWCTSISPSGWHEALHCSKVLLLFVSCCCLVMTLASLQLMGVVPHCMVMAAVDWLMTGSVVRGAPATYIGACLHIFPYVRNGCPLCAAPTGEYLACAGMLLALISVVYSALRAGSNTALFRFASAEADAADQPLLDDETGRNYVKVQHHMPLLPVSACPTLRKSDAGPDARAHHMVLALAWALTRKL